MAAGHKSYKATICESLAFSGIGFKSGYFIHVKLKPSVDIRGIYFVRVDMPAGLGVIDASWMSASDMMTSTNLSNEYGVGVSNVERLLAALNACGIDNVCIEIDGSEIPIMDGGTDVFIDKIYSVGRRYLKQTKQGIWIKKPIVINEGDKSAMLIPSSIPRISVCVDSPSSSDQSQCYSVTLNGERCFDEITYTKTQGFKGVFEGGEDENFTGQSALLNTENTDGRKVFNTAAWNINNEFIRHKIFSVIGDMSLAGAPIMGHYYAYKAGHFLNHQLLKKLFSDTSTWVMASLEEGKGLFANTHSVHDKDDFQHTLNVVPFKKTQK